MEKFEIVRSDSGWRVRFKGANGEPIVWSEHYTERDTALDAINLIRRAVLTGVLTFDVDERTHG